MPIYYDNKVEEIRRANFIVESSVLIELKATVKLEDFHLAQGLNYLEAYKIEKGLLINFGAPALRSRDYLGSAIITQISARTPFCSSINPDPPNSDH